MTTVEHTSDSELDDPKKITDAASCLDYLKRREVFLYKMMNDPGHKAMLYFLEVLMNSDTPLTVEQLASRFTHKTFSSEMREACGGGSAQGLREFLLRYPSLFHVRSNDQVDSVAIELPGMEGLYDGLNDSELCFDQTTSCSTTSPPLTNGQTTDKSLFRGNTFDMSTGRSGNGFQSMNLKRTNNRFRLPAKGNDLMNRAKLKSTSSLSLESSPSNASSSSESMNSFNRSQVNDKSDCVSRRSLNGAEANESHNVTSPTWQPKRGIYQPPPLREQNGTRNSESNQIVKPCSRDFRSNSEKTNSVYESNKQNPTAPTPDSCGFCPLCDLVCHHHCSMTHNHHLHHQHLHHHHHPHTQHHHHGDSHCPCSAAAHSAPRCCSCCLTPSPPCNAIPRTNSTTNTTAVITQNVCALPPMEKLFIETEAVRFFQQRLLKREERWVQIKSLAGHLSQASAEIRTIVGPQLEFRAFLLKHPHVFEVQGELVSVKDPFGNLFPTSRRTRDRFAAIHPSFSSTNLSALSMSSNLATAPILTRSNGNERMARPKSLILSGTGSLLPSPFIPSALQNAGTRRANEHRRSTHFADSCVTNYYPKSTTDYGSSGNLSSDPSTPTGTHASQSDRRSGTTKSLMSGIIPNATEPDTDSKAQSAWSCPVNPSTDTGLSIRMSANEYRAIMFLRKMLDRRGSTIQQDGLSLSDLMISLSTKAPETVQAVIGYTKVELEEFIRQQPIFFELYATLPETAKKSDTDCTETSVVNDSCAKRVRNKRLEKMINIVITGSKTLDASTQRTLTNRSGRIFHVAKLWGIIDLGKHEHVFFDKSIFKHVDDLQKYFKIDETIYFNAILAPKESRAKWRATLVWKECDRNLMESLNYSSANYRSASDTINPGKVLRSNITRRHSSTPKPLICMHPMESEDTEADEEIEEIEYDPTSHPKSMPDNGMIHPLTDSDCDCALHSGDELGADDDSCSAHVSAIARQEGLHLVSDVQFISDDMSQGTSQDKGISSTNCISLRDSVTSCPRMEAESERRNNFVSSSTEQNPHDCSCSKSTQSCDCSKEDQATASISSTGSSGISIAVQTMSTGEIMAIQLYHDATKEEPCPSA